MRTKNQTPTAFKGGKLLKENKANKNLVSSLKPASQTTTPKKKFQPGKLALREIRKYQHTTDLVIRKAPFKRLIRNIMATMDDASSPIRFQKSAFMMIQTATEYFMVNILEDALKLTTHAKRKTLFGDDIKLIYRIKHANDFDVHMLS